MIGNSNWKEENGFNFRLVVLEIGKLFRVDLVFLAGEFLDLIFWRANFKSGNKIERLEIEIKSNQPI